MHTVNSGVQFLRQLDLEEPDIIMLSTRLADISGIELLQRLREFSHTPVIVLCDECGEDERVQLFDLGADDLLLKPFSMKELLARSRALLRRHAPPIEQSTSQTIFTTGDLTIDYAQHLVLMQGRPAQLSRFALRFNRRTHPRRPIYRGAALAWVDRDHGGGRGRPCHCCPPGALPAAGGGASEC